MAKYTPEEAQKIVDDYNDHIAKGIPITKELADRMRDASVGIKNYSDNLKSSLEALKGSALKMAGAIKDGETGLSVYNETVEAGGKALGNWAEKIPIVGGSLKKLANGAAEATVLINKQADSLFQTYQQISRSGLAVGMKDTFANLEAAGYTAAEIKDYGALLTQNASVLATFGGTAAQGAQQFADVAASIQSSDLQTQFMQMGMSVGDINDGIVNYVKIRQMSGSSRVQTTEELKESAKGFIENQDRLAKITGLNAAQQNKAIETQLAKEQFAAHTAELQAKIDKGGAEGKAAEEQMKKEQDAIKFATAKGSQAIADDMALFFSGSVNNPGYARFQRSFPSFAKKSKDGLSDSGELFNSFTQDAKKTASEVATLGTVGEAGKTFGDIAGIVKAAGASQVNYNEATKKADTDQAKQKGPLQDAGTASQVKLRQDQRDTTKSLDTMINTGIGPVSKTFKHISDAGQQLIGTAGQLAGKQGQMGGGKTLVEKTGIVSQSGGSAATQVTPTTGNSASVNAPLTAPAAPSEPTFIDKAKDAIGLGGSAAKNAASGTASSAVAGMDAVKQMIIRHEGLKTRPYQDSAGLWTVGVGHLIGDGKSLPQDMNREFSKEEIMALFEKDFAKHYAIAQMTPGWEKANEAGKGAMIDLAFNMGQWWTKFPNTAKALAAGDWANAAAGLRDSKWYKQVGGRASEVTGMIAQAGDSAGINKNPQAAMGGILSGPNSGFSSTLHGTEAVIPLPDGRTIPVANMGGGDEYSAQINNLMSIKINKLEMLVASMSKHNATSQKILQRQS